MGSLDEETLLRGQVEVWQLMFGFAESMSLKCAIELGIADIINSLGGPVTLNQIASGSLQFPLVDIPYLARIMRFLVRKRVFTQHNPSDGGETLYWVLHDWGDEYCVKILKNSRKAMPEKTGKLILVEIVLQPEGNDQFRDMGMVSDLVMFAHSTGGKESTELEWKKLLEEGGFPRYKIINIPALPSIIETYLQITNGIASSMKLSLIIFGLSLVLHDWGDECCVKILKNCRKAMPEKTGKLILVEIVLQPEGNGQFGDMGMVSDLVMFAHGTGGKERTELEWKKLLEEGGFPRYKIINIPALPSIIEACLQ
ncbi:PREDICTED: (R,S)-reticuline 7-O-methyltransferase-like [Populus euphratica]|uniref:(R,S)-reticuline 7-O-methyltransferase-like n=1 Tax=Populus euphratica TaxID=75702 RepID=A0AAJ6V1K0_POPEU|nr:PREDICTED: (R,S)-reticuline 7-O-methyltransferase-like [Populus euphratica]